ncbi:MAG TPA: energy transducer TonB [Acidobacteriaceae bacterium]|jgi:protein TonB|nr:energy transducer TonB [Acidobacteriaceae bacterium]
MFEDSLVESSHRIRTHAQRYVAGSFFLEAALVTLLVLLPYFYPEALPRKFLLLPLLPPPPPAASAPAQRTAAAPVAHTEILDAAIVAPSHIPRTWNRIIDSTPPGPNLPNLADLGRGRTGVLGIPDLGTATPPAVVPVRPVQPAPRLRVSAGVAAGQLIVPIQPVYPAIAMQARVQGTVVVDAVIGKDGRIASLHVISGPPLLAGAAVTAIQRARYRPWTLNGEPVEVETTIRIVFSLGDTHFVSRNAFRVGGEGTGHSTASVVFGRPLSCVNFRV